jgi:cytochrome c1
VPLLLISACDETQEAIDKRVADARPAAGKAIIFRVGCGVCHIIPGIPGANGTVGPSLESFAERNLIGGVVPNRPELLAQWVRDAPSLIEETGMPDLPITEEEARNVAEYLYTLR